MLIGNVGKDPEVRHLESGVPVATISIATTERYKDKNGEVKKQTEWHNVVLWNALAEFAEKYVQKGKQVYVEGKLRSRSWEDQSGQKHYATDIVANELKLLGKKSDTEQQSGGATADKPAVASVEPPIEPPAGDDLPF
jgi:single-strand DNA-binding protein